MTLREFNLQVAEAKTQTKTLFSECLAHAMLQGDWEFISHGGQGVVLVDMNAGMALVRAHTFVKDPYYSCAKCVMDGDSFVVVERHLYNLKEVCEFLNA